MLLREFEDIPITTITAFADLEGTIDYVSCFPLFRFFSSIPISKKKGKGIPHPGKGGLLLQGNFGSVSRGVPISLRSTYFRNGIPVFVSTKEKNVSIQIYSSGLHFRGIKSEEMAKEAAETIFSQVRQIQADLDFLSSSDFSLTRQFVKEKTECRKICVFEGTTILFDSNVFVSCEDGQIRTFTISSLLFELFPNETKFQKFSNEELLKQFREWQSLSHYLLEALSSNFHLKKISEIAIFFEFFSSNIFVELSEKYGIVKIFELFSFQKHEFVSSICVPFEYYEYMKNGRNIFPDGVDPRVACFLIDHAHPFSRHDWYCFHIDWIFSIKQVLFPPEGVDLSRKFEYPKIKRFRRAMVNYNYSLGRKINRWKIYSKFASNSPFIARYDNAVDIAVKVLYPISNVPKELENQIIYKKAQRNHTFLIYESGHITQSGPHEILNKEVYSLFRKILEKEEN
jgi:hypothetical protein